MEDPGGQERDLRGRSTYRHDLFGDTARAKETLKALRTAHAVTHAVILDADGALFATYSASGKADASQALQAATVAEWKTLVVRSEIYADDQRIGTISSEIQPEPKKR